MYICGIQIIKTIEIMNREIKFRGKRIDNGEWITGYYGILGEGTDIESHVIMVSTLQTSGTIDRFYFTDYEVIPESVGQFIGLLDKNGADIYEDDIVKTKYQESAKVVWHNEFACFCYETIDEIIKGEYQFFFKQSEIEIIENPELL